MLCENYFDRLLVCVAVLLSTSCNNDRSYDLSLPHSDDSFVGTELTVHASFGGDIDPTRTAMQSDGSSIYWTLNDAINLFYGELYSGKFTSKITDPSLSADFTGVLNAATGTAQEGGEARKFWGVYPYNSFNSCDGSGVTMSIPSKQRGVTGSFANKLNPSVARSSGLDLAFYNVGTWFRFTVTEDNISSVIFKGKDDEIIAGKIRVSMDDKSKPVYQVLEGKKSITITPSETECFAVNQEYWIVLLPQVFKKGFSLIFLKTDGSSAQFNFSNEVAFNRSYSVRKLQADYGLKFQQGVPDFESLVEDLSEMGTANSYIVSKAGTYKFKAVQGNTNIPVDGIVGTKVLWKSFGNSTTPSENEMIPDTDVSFSDGFISFSTSDAFSEGNAVIAAYSDSDCTYGNVLWSWHIWLTDEPKEQVYHNYSGTMMDRNLGSTSPTAGEGSTSLFYQWGRKDPFIGPIYLTTNTKAACRINTSNGKWPDKSNVNEIGAQISFVTANPATFASYNSMNQDWYYTGTTSTDNTRWNSSKGIQDPCPPGWRVPDGGQFGIWSTALETYSEVTDFDFDYQNKGAQFGGGASKSLGESESIWYPMTGYYSMADGSLSSGTTSGSYWSCTPSDFDSRACYFYLYGTSGTFGSSKSLKPTVDSYRAEGRAIRCVRE